jgi:general stress protein YciG
MAGTKAGAAKAAATNKARHGADFYAKIGRKGGQNGHTGGFAANPALAKVAGAKGGRISRRGPAKTSTKSASDDRIQVNVL